MSTRSFVVRILPLIAFLSAAAEAKERGRPGPVVADVRGQAGLGTALVLGSVGVATVEPEVLFLRPDGSGFGVELCYGILGGAYGSAETFGGAGPKYVVVRRFAQSPFCSKVGAGFLALSGREGIGGRAVFEYGVVPLVAGRAAFPIEAFLSGQYVRGWGISATLGLSAGVGWVFGSESQDEEN